MEKLKKILYYTAKALFYAIIAIILAITIQIVTYKPIVHDDSEMFRLGYIRHLEDSIISETGKGSIDTMQLDSVKMTKIFYEFFSEK